MSSPETPKSHILIWPEELHKIFDGFMSIDIKSLVSLVYDTQKVGLSYTSMDYPVNVV